MSTIFNEKDYTKKYYIFFKENKIIKEKKLSTIKMKNLPSASVTMMTYWYNQTVFLKLSINFQKSY